MFLDPFQYFNSIIILFIRTFKFNIIKFIINLIQESGIPLFVIKFPFNHHKMTLNLDNQRSRQNHKPKNLPFLTLNKVTRLSLLLALTSFGPAECKELSPNNVILGYETSSVDSNE